MGHAELHIIWAYFTCVDMLNLQNSETGDHYPGFFDMVTFVGEWEPLNWDANMHLKMQQTSKPLQSR